MSRGFALLEVVIGAGIVVIFFFALINALSTATELNERNLRQVRAAALMVEGVETIGFWRASGWGEKIAPLTTGTLYSLAWSDGTWVATTTPTLIDGLFDRRFRFTTAYRDGNQDLATSGTADAGTRQLDVTVAWLERGATTTATTTTYLTNLFGN